MSSGCSSVGKVVASNTRDARFESSHRQTVYYLLAVKCIEKTKRKEKETGVGAFFKKKTKKLAYFYNFLPSGEISPKSGHTDRDRRGR